MKIAARGAGHPIITTDSPESTCSRTDTNSQYRGKELLDIFPGDEHRNAIRLDGPHFPNLVADFGMPCRLHLAVWSRKIMLRKLYYVADKIVCRTG
jgi:hypothetical protein